MEKYLLGFININKLMHSAESRLGETTVKVGIFRVESCVF